MYTLEDLVPESQNTDVCIESVDKTPDKNDKEILQNKTTSNDETSGFPTKSQPETPTGSDPATSLSVSDENVAAVTEIDQELLDLLGETPCKDKKYGPNIQNDLSVRWNHIATSGLSKEARKDLIKDNLIPENCQLIDAPILNAEARAALSDTLIKKDKSLEQKQKQRAAALSCLGDAITKLLSAGNKDATYIKPLIIAGRLLCDLQHNDSMIRRSFICSTLKKEIKDHLYKTEIDKYLFGDKLADTIKTAKVINKSGADMKTQAHVKQNVNKRFLNLKTPLPNSRQPEVARRQAPAPGPSRQRLPPATAATPTTSQRPQRQQPRSQVFATRRR
ncbi:uncharacterized protein [Choristoneura fumiferana]|uniref:uncharacterized protein n=1 Tax=Choristoneura fumiferana TaxID=7141 RepID=UPI003D15D651